MKLIAPALLALALAGTAIAAEPEYVTIRMEVDVARPAAEVWAKVGGYCDISQWLAVDCTISSGTGGIGTVRALRGGQVKEILVGRTELSYGYTQPAREGQFYNLYHGYLEAQPLGATRSKLLYTLMLDVSDKPDQAAKDADLAARRTRFEGALQKMKSIAEGATG